MGIFNITDTDSAEKETLVNNEKTDLIVNDEKTEEVNKDSKSENKTIVLDGPLSTIYTKALNMVYSKEDVINMMDSDNVNNDTSVSTVAYTKDESEEPKESELYMYCCSSEDIESGKFIEVTDKLRIALDNKKSKKVILAIENSGVVTNKYALLTEYASNLGIECYYSRTAAINSIKNTIKVK